MDYGGSAALKNEDRIVKEMKIVKEVNMVKTMKKVKGAMAHDVLAVAIIKRKSEEDPPRNARSDPSLTVLHHQVRDKLLVGISCSFCTPTCIVL